jgi:hypothetical protein
MDPNQTWRDLSQAFSDDDWDRIDELASSLAEWLDRGGFPPSITGEKEFDKLVVKNALDALLAWDIC